MTEGKRAIIFVGAILNVLLLNQSVTSNLQADRGIRDYRVVSRTYERFGNPNSSITNQSEFGRHRSDISRFRSEPSRRILNTPSYSPARFSFIGRPEEHFQFERQRRIFREPRDNRQERNRAIINDSPLLEQIQRRSMKVDFNNSRYFRYSEIPVGRSIRRSTFSLPKRFLNLESVAPLKPPNNRDRRIDSRFRDSRNSEFHLYRTRELERNTDELGDRRTRSMRTSEADRNQNSNRVLSRNSETSSLAHSLFKAISNCFPHNSIPSLELDQINDFIVSTIAGILLYDMMGAMTQNKAVAVKTESFGNFVEKMVFAVRKMVAH